MRSTKNFTTGSSRFIGATVSMYRPVISTAIKAGPGCHRGEHEYYFDDSVKRFRCALCRVLQPTNRMHGEPYQDIDDGGLVIID